MTEPAGSPLSSRRRHFSKFVVSGIIGTALLSSFAEQDRRSLFFGDREEAFAVSEVGASNFDGGGPYSIYLADRTGDRRPTRSRRIPRALPTGLPGDGAFNPISVGVGGSDPGASADALQLASVDTPAVLVPSAGPSGSNGNFGSPIGQASGPVGDLVIVPTDPDPGPVDPVVPAVPEPASWILMIIGVGLLGSTLRLRRNRFERGSA